MQILFFFRYLLTLPLEFFRFVWSIATNFQTATPRQRALVLSLPAVFTAITGLTFLGIASSIRESTLLQRYRALAEATNGDFKKEFLNFAKLVQESKKNGTPVGSNSGSNDPVADAENNENPEVKARREQLREMRNTEILYWEKLINLQPSNDEFRYHHALAHQFLDNSRMLTLLTSIAPPKQPGYKDAHLWLAEYYHALANQSPRLQQVLMREAVNHAEQAILQDKDNETALQIKGEAYYRLGQYESASEAFTEVVRINPTKFLALVELNELRNVPPNETELFLRTVKITLMKSVDIERNTISKWERSLTALVQCLSRLKELTEIRVKLTAETKLAEKTEDKSLRMLIINRLLGDSILADIEQKMSLYRGTNKPTQDQLQSLVDGLNEAKILLPDSEGIKRISVGLVIEYPNLKSALLQVYDPAADPNPPAFVFDRLGVADLMNQNYSSAIQNLEKAMNLDPENATILNNLAFAYLSRNTPESANQAVLYSELAFKAVEKSPQIAKDPVLMSNFNHTRGSALMATGDYVRAAGYFEQSLRGRPNHIGTLESLIKCFETYNQEKANFYRQRLNDVLQKENEADGK